MHAGLGRLHRVFLIVDRTGGTGEIVDLVDLDIEGEGDIVPEHLEIRFVLEVHNVRAAAGEIVVEAHDFMPFRHQAATQMRAKKACAAGHEYPLADGIMHGLL